MALLCDMKECGTIVPEGTPPIQIKDKLFVLCVVCLSGFENFFAMHLHPGKQIPVQTPAIDFGKYIGWPTTKPQPQWFQPGVPYGIPGEFKFNDTGFYVDNKTDLESFVDKDVLLPKMAAPTKIECPMKYESATIGKNKVDIIGTQF